MLVLKKITSVITWVENWASWFFHEIPFLPWKNNWQQTRVNEQNEHVTSRKTTGHAFCKWQCLSFQAKIGIWGNLNSIIMNLTITVSKYWKTFLMRSVTIILNVIVVIFYNKHPKIWKIYTSHEDSIFQMSNELSSKVTYE